MYLSRVVLNYNTEINGGTVYGNKYGSSSHDGTDSSVPSARS